MDNWLAVMERKLFLIALIGYGLSALVYLLYILFPKKIPRALPTIVLAIVSAINVGIVILRSIETGRSPMASRYESITFFGMTIGVIYLLTEWRLKIKFGGLFASLISFGLFSYIVLVDLGSNLVPITWANILYLVLEHGKSQMTSMPLMPALQSPWFFWHVSLAFFGYAFFTTGFVLEVTSSCISIARKKEFFPILRKALIALAVTIGLFLIGKAADVTLIWVLGIIGMSLSTSIVLGMLLGWRHVGVKPPALRDVLIAFAIAVSLALVAVVAKLTFLMVFAILAICISGIMVIGVILGWRKSGTDPFTDDDIARLRRFTHNQVLFAYPLLMWCLLSGAAWADKAWGTYWGWDAKEIWSLITVLIYACYFHLRGYARWRGRPASIVHIIGFISVITTYLMVNYLVKWFDLFSLHAYA